MRQRKLLLFCLLISTSTIFGCTSAPLKQSVNENNKPALKNWNEAEHRLPSTQHRQETKSLRNSFQVLFSIRVIPVGNGWLSPSMMDRTRLTLWIEKGHRHRPYSSL